MGPSLPEGLNCIIKLFWDMGFWSDFVIRFLTLSRQSQFYFHIDDDNNGKETDAARNNNASGLTGVVRKDFGTIVSETSDSLFLFPFPPQ